MNFLKILQKLGNDTPKTVLSIIALMCTANATLRPMFTLLNPNEPMKRKRYAALRESLTEFLAIPVLISLAMVLKNWVSPAFIQKQTAKADKEVLKKFFTVIGLGTGNVMVPFVATGVIGVLFKLFPGLNGKQPPAAQKLSIVKPSAPQAYTCMQKNPNSKPFPASVPYPSYAMFRTPSL